MIMNICIYIHNKLEYEDHCILNCPARIYLIFSLLEHTSHIFETNNQIVKIKFHCYFYLNFLKFQTLNINAQ